MTSRPPHTTGCTRSRDGSSAIEGVASRSRSIRSMDRAPLTTLRASAIATCGASTSAPDHFILERDGFCQIAVAPADGSLPAQGMGPKVPAAVSGIGHAWAPDGRTLLVTFLTEGEPQTFWAIDVDTGRTTELGGPFVEIPAWQRLAP
jgi:hypothetical protein